jgi:hypothetical protein
MPPIGLARRFGEADQAAEDVGQEARQQGGFPVRAFCLFLATKLGALPQDFDTAFILAILE